MNSAKTIILAITVALGSTLSASAVLGTFSDTITIDGLFDDWTNIPVLATDASGDNGGGPDLATVQIANNDTWLFLRLTYYNATNPNAGPSVFLALDNDSNLSTGFDVFSAGLVGSEAGWQNDFPFEQSNTVFNTGGGLTGGGAAISPFFVVTTQQEYRISRSATFTASGNPIFPTDTFTLLVYTDPTGANETAGPIQYTFAVPEPGTFSLLAISAVCASLIRRQKRT